MIIGLTGGKGVGKSTVAKVFVEKGFTELAFADPLKRAAAELLGIPADWLLSASSQDKEAIVPGFNFTYRTFLQKLGTDFARDMIINDFWIDRMEVSLASLSKTTPIVISDIRFDNEAKLVLDKGGIIIKVDRPVSGDKDTHISEKGISSDIVQYIFNNQGTLDSLPTEVDSFVKDLLNNNSIAIT